MMSAFPSSSRSGEIQFRHDSAAALRDEIVASDLCPDLREYSAAAAGKRKEYPADGYWGKPVPGYGDPNAHLWILGLCPGVHGANRTGVAFWGDTVGNWIYSMLKVMGFQARVAGGTDAGGGDDIPPALRDVWMSYIVRSAAPRNRPKTEDIAAWRGILHRERIMLGNVRAVIAVGDLTYKTILRVFAEEEGQTVDAAPFEHGACVRFSGGLPSIICCANMSDNSIKNDQVTRTMLAGVLRQAKQCIGA